MSKVRVWEDVFVHNALKHCIQIKENIEHAVKTTETSPGNLPPSLLSSDMLYNLACCYVTLYTVTLDRDLLETGNTQIRTDNLH
jgi:hypothetical protein